MEVSDFFTNVLICYFGVALIMGDGLHKLGVFTVVLLGKVLIYLLSFITYKKKQKMQGNFKNGIRKELMEAIFIKKKYRRYCAYRRVSNRCMDGCGMDWIAVYKLSNAGRRIANSKLILTGIANRHNNCVFWFSGIYTVDAFDLIVQGLNK